MKKISLFIFLLFIYINVNASTLQDSEYITNLGGINSINPMGNSLLWDTNYYSKEKILTEARNSQEIYNILQKYCGEKYKENFSDSTFFNLIGYDESKNNNNYIAINDCFGSNNKDYSNKIIVIKNGQIIDIFNAYNLFYDKNNQDYNKTWLKVIPNISNDGNHVMYNFSGLEHESNVIYLEKIYKAILGISIDNIKITDYRDEKLDFISAKDFLQKNNLELKFNRQSYFINEQHYEKNNDNTTKKVEYKLVGKYFYELSEDTMNKIDEALVKINSKNYEKLVNSFKEKFNYYSSLGDKMTFSDYKKQILYYYIFSELKIMQLKMNGTPRY